MPVVSGRGDRLTREILTGSSRGNPRLSLVSSLLGYESGGERPVTVRLRFTAPIPGEFTYSVTVRDRDYFSAPLEEITGSFAGTPWYRTEAVVTIETDDPQVHALLVRSDPVNGSPTVLSSD